MKIHNLTSLLFVAGLVMLLTALLVELPFGHGPMQTGQSILEQAPQTTGTANIVTSVVLGYRGLDTLGELTILFIAATAVGLVLGKQTNPHPIRPGGYILRIAADVLHPFLLLLGVYIIVHGHLTPGGGFQGGVILAIAYFLPLLAGTENIIQEKLVTVLEGLAGAAFITIGLLSLIKHGDFLAPLLGTGTLGELFSGGTLPLLYIAVGLKVGSEMAGLMMRMLQEDGPTA